MVFCGRPSKNCQACREKKTRCDRAIPECSQCIRAKRACSGYRDQLDLMFRNESNAVAKKMKARGTKSKSASKKPLSYLIIPPSEIQFGDQVPDEISPITLSSHALQPTIEEVAGAFFNTNYEMRSVGGSFDFFNFDNVDTLCTPGDMSSHLIASINAVGLAGFANSVRSTVLMKKAFNYYGTAIQLTNAALHSPADAVKDNTLFSVVILSIFETVTGSTQNSFQAWTEHTKGASTLVKLRGPDQFKTHAGRRLFLQITSNLLISCIQRTVAVPDYISELRVEAEKYVESSNPAWRMSKVIIDCSKFRADVINGSITGSQNVISRALEIDREFVEIFSHVPESWRYTTIYTDEHPELVWNGMFHSYQNYWIAQIWNSVRTCRILLHEIVHSQLKLVVNDSPRPFTKQASLDLYQSSFNILIQMRTDILASIPEHTKTKIVQAAHHHTMCPEVDDPPTASALLGTRGYFVLWPLYLVGSMDLSTNEIRRWVMNRLRSLSEETGIRQASVLAEFVGRNKHISVWDREAHWKRLANVEVPYLENSGGVDEEIKEIGEIDSGSGPSGSGIGFGVCEMVKSLRVLSY